MNKHCVKCKVRLTKKNCHQDKVNGLQSYCKTCKKDKHKEWVQKNLTHAKNYQNAYRKKWRREHPVLAVERDKQNNQKRRSTEFGRLRTNLACRIRSAIKKGYGYKNTLTTRLLGCSIEEVKKHLEKLFQPGMTWMNYGEWHIDHILPCASFDLTKEEEQKKCFHFTNLQPLWKADNLRKSDKL